MVLGPNIYIDKVFSLVYNIKALGALTQLVACHTGSVEVRGSSPLCSTKKSLIIDEALIFGGVAHLVERYIRIVEVTGSSPAVSTKKDPSNDGSFFSLW